MVMGQGRMTAAWASAATAASVSLRLRSSAVTASKMPLRAADGSACLVEKRLSAGRAVDNELAVLVDAQEQIVRTFRRKHPERVER